MPASISGLEERSSQTARILSIFAITGAMLAGGLALRLILEPFTGALAGYIYFLPSVVVGAIFGGVVPALLITVLAAVLGLSGVAADGLSQQELFYALMFSLNGLFVAYLAARVGREHRDAVTSAKELRSREAHLTSILETVPDAIIVIDERGAIASFNAAAEKLFQWRADEIAGRNISLLMPPPHRDRRSKYIERYMRTGTAKIIGRNRQLTAVRKDGTEFPIELSVGEVRSIPRHFIGFIRDLTERQQSSAKMQALQSELLHVSRMNAMGEMAAMLAHELNQPLAAIVNFHGAKLRMIEQRPTAAAISLKPLVDEAAEQALRAGEIISRIRSFVGNGDVERRPVFLDSAIRDAVGFATVGSIHARVRIEVDGEMASVMADPVQLQQVLLNLIRNALEASAGEADAAVVVRAKAARGKFAQVSVEDQGPGIAADVLPHLFQAFFSTKPDGMGIGLSICQTIVEAHGGKIWVEANSPRGSVFKFVLPFIKDESGWKRQQRQSPLSMTTQQ